MKCFQRDSIARDGMFHRAKRLKFCRLEIESRIKDFPRVLFFATGFKIWKFPKLRVHNSRWSLLNEKFSVPLNDEGKKRSSCRCLAFTEVWQFLRSVFI